MAGRRQRAAIGMIAATLALVSGIVLAERFVFQAEWWQVDRSTTRAPAARLLDVGPPPGPLAQTYRLDTPVRHSGLAPYDQVGYAVVAGQVVVAGGHGVDVKDARTGRTRWHYHRDGWSLLGWAATDGRLIAYLERTGDRQDRELVGFTAATGAMLWRRHDELPAATELTGLRFPAGSDTFLATAPDDRRTLLGLSAATGDVLWRTALPRRCAVPEAGAFASDAAEADGAALVALGLDCGPHSRILALDPRTGENGWSHELSASEPPQVSVRGTAVAVSDGGSLRIYDRAGREFAVRPGDDVCGATMCPVVSLGQETIVVYRAGQGDAGRRLEGIDAATGRSLWQRSVPAYVSMAASGGRVYALRPSVGPGVLPAGVDQISPATGAASTVPVPVVLPPGKPGRLAAAGGLLYVAAPEALPRPDGGVRLTVLRGASGGLGASAGEGPVALGNVPVGEWPDACSLLAGAGLPGRARPTYATVAGIRLPRPVRCTYPTAAEPTPSPPATRTPRRTASPPATPASPSQTPAASAGPADQSASVTLEWVAGSTDAAAGLMNDLRDTQLQSRPVDAGDDAYQLDPPSGTLVMRVDRYIVSVNAYQTPGLAVRLAQTAAGPLATEPPA